MMKKSEFSVYHSGLFTYSENLLPCIGTLVEQVVSEKAHVREF